MVIYNILKIRSLDCSKANCVQDGANVVLHCVQYVKWDQWRLKAQNE